MHSLHMSKSCDEPSMRIVLPLETLQGLRRRAPVGSAPRPPMSAHARCAAHVLRSLATQDARTREAHTMMSLTVEGSNKKTKQKKTKTKEKKTNKKKEKKKKKTNKKKKKCIDACVSLCATVSAAFLAGLRRGLDIVAVELLPRVTAHGSVLWQRALEAQRAAPRRGTSVCVSGTCASHRLRFRCPLSCATRMCWSGPCH